jgi:hypothetical protein
MKCGLFAFFFVVAFTISLASASLDSAGIYKLGENITFTQPCSEASYITLSLIRTPTQIIVVDENMTSLASGVFGYNYTTSETGKIYFEGASDGCEQTFATYITVTLNGKEQAEGIIIVVFSLIFIAIFGFGLVYFLKSLAHIAQLDMDLIDCAIMIATYLAMWMFYYFSFEYLGNEFINGLLEMMITVGAVTHVFLPLVGFVVSFIMTNLKFKQKARITY